MAEVSPATLNVDGIVTVTGKSVGSANLTLKFFDANGELTNYGVIIPLTVNDSTPPIQPQPPVTPPILWGGISNNAGTNKVDTVTAKPGTILPKPVTKKDVDKALSEDVAKLPTGSKDVTVNLQNSGIISPEVMQYLEQKVSEKGFALTLNLNTIENGKVIGRVNMHGGSSGQGFIPSFNLTRAQLIERLFRKYFSNDLFAVCLNQQGELGRTVSVSIPLPKGIKTENLVVYSYDMAKNTYVKVGAKALVDKNGYVHFDTTVGGDFVISNGEFVKK